MPCLRTSLFLTPSVAGWRRWWTWKKKGINPQSL
jgi:hypothetical protein